MPCYVIAHKHFRDKAHYRRFAETLARLAETAPLRLHPLDDTPQGDGGLERSILMEFGNARQAQAFLASRPYRDLAASECISA